MAQSLMDQVTQYLGEKTVDNKRKWEGNHNNNYNQNKSHEVAKVYTVGPIDKGKYAGNLSHCNPLYEQQIKETKTRRGTYLPDMVVNRMGIIGMNVQKQKTRPEATRIREANMVKSMVKETRMGIKLAETLVS
nr:hypothetical protein [Tanacetum cinerariifolium]